MKTESPTAHSPFPTVKPFLPILESDSTDESFTVDGNFYTTQCEHTLSRLLLVLLEVLKK